MSNHLSPEQETFHQELLGCEIPESIAVIIALKTNWAEIRVWDEDHDLRKLGTLIWQTGIIESHDQSMQLARKIKLAGLNSIYPKQHQPRAALTEIGDLVPDIPVQDLLTLDEGQIFALWQQVKQTLEEKAGQEGLTPDEKNYLILATIYTA